MTSMHTQNDDHGASGVTPIGAADAAQKNPDLGRRRRDLILVAGIVAGDVEAFDRLHALYRDRIYRFAIKRLGDPFEADDVCQDVFLQIFRCIGSYEGRSSLLTWMFGIAHHQICRRYRRRNLEILSVDAPETFEIRDEQAPTDRQVEAARVLKECGRVVEEKLSETQQRIFRLRYAENHSTREVASELGKSNQAIKISLFRSRQMLVSETTGLDDLLTA